MLSLPNSLHTFFKRGVAPRHFNPSTVSFNGTAVRSVDNSLNNKASL